jgi:hypothetical protein
VSPVDDKVRILLSVLAPGTRMQAVGQAAISNDPQAPVPQLARISTQRIRPRSGEFEVELAVAPPGNGGVGGEVGLAQDG